MVLQPPPPPTHPVASTSNSHNTTSSSSSEPINDALSRDFPQVASLSKEDLLSLLDDPTHFASYFNTLPAPLSQHQEVEDALMRNIEIAKKNEGMRAGLEALREETMRYDIEARGLMGRWEEVRGEMERGYQRFLPPTQLSRLLSSSSLQTSLSEQLVSAFLNNEMDEAVFSRQYREVRRVGWKRGLVGGKWEKGEVVWRN